MESVVLENNPRIALVYDRVNTRFGGAEYVLETLHKIFPTAPLYTSVYSQKSAIWANGWNIKSSFLQRLPFAQQHHRAYLPLMPIAFESLDFSAYDIVISISSAEAKGIITPASTLHINYLLTPTRYLWSHHLDYQHGLFSLIKSLFFSRLRTWDFLAAQRPDVIIPISELVKQRAEKYYQRRIEEVIYPPFRKFKVLSSKFQNETPQPSPINHPPYFLVVSRLVDYKKVDLAIETCARLQKKLIIIGDGPEKKRLNDLISSLNANELVQIISGASFAEITEYYLKANALLLLAEEDFGLVALESQSLRTPVIVYKNSGAAEVVIHNQTGVHVESQTTEAVAKAISTLETMQFDQTLIEQQAERYNTDQFTETFTAKIRELWKVHQRHNIY